tara:strand:- start:533 stop:712 length:180 start_codon:yes stop_codon:yes gene_type:complete
MVGDLISGHINKVATKPKLIRHISSAELIIRALITAPALLFTTVPLQPVDKNMKFTQSG